MRSTTPDARTIRLDALVVVMPDFSLCRGERRFSNGVADLCPKRAYCRRYIAAPGPLQSWMSPPQEMASCPDFWPVQYIPEERE